MVEGPLIRPSLILEFSASIRNSVNWINNELGNCRTVLFDNLNVNPVDREKDVTEIYLRNIIAAKFLDDENDISSSKKDGVIQRLVTVIVEILKNVVELKNFTAGM